MLSAIGCTVERWFHGNNPWSKSYGVSRSLLAFSTILTLTFTKSDVLFGAGLQPVAGARRLIPFSLFPSANPQLARWSAVVILLIVASGWRPRVTSVPHWWISASVFDAAIPVDGGDQIAAVLTLLLLPVCLTDDRRWQWQRSDGSNALDLRRITALSALVAIRVQVAAVYFQAVSGKLSVEEWRDGTAVYYWLTDPYYGAADWLKPLLMPLLRNPFAVNLITWGSILIELLLFVALVMPRRAWPTVMVVGLLFHAVIGIVQGLITFSTAMAAALILYLCPSDCFGRRSGFSQSIPVWDGVAVAKPTREGGMRNRDP